MQRPAIDPLSMHNTRLYVLGQCIKNCQGTYNQPQVIYNNAEVLLNNYPQLNAENMTISEGLYSKKCVQLTGAIPVNSVQYRQTFHVKVSIQIPPEYPSAKPRVYVLNPDTNMYKVDQYYKKFEINAGILTMDYDALQNWPNHRNIVQLVQSLQNMLATVLPFQQKAQQHAPAAPQGQQPPAFHHAQQQPPPQPQMHQVPSGGNAQHYKPPALNGVEQAPNNQQEDKYEPYYSDQYSGVQKKLYQMAFDALTAQIKRFRAEFRENNDRMHLLCQEERELARALAELHHIDHEIGKENELVRAEVERFKTYYAVNESITLNDQTVQEVLTGTDPLQQQIIDLSADLRATKDALNCLTQSFKTGQIQLQDYLQLYKQFSDKQFDIKALLKKCNKKLKN